MTVTHGWLSFYRDRRIFRKQKQVKGQKEAPYEGKGCLKRFKTLQAALRDLKSIFV